MSRPLPSLLARPDTVFGVCQGMGEDLNFPPNLFRVGFGIALFFAPLVSVATYFLLGLVVAATRFAFPVPGIADSGSVAEKSSEQAEEALPLAA